MIVQTNPMDEFTTYHESLIEGTYDCVDRIVVNAYYPLGQSPGGFRTWWRRLTGSDDTLDRAHMQRMAGRFMRRLQAYAKKHNIPVIFCEAGERKHEMAEKYLPVVSGSEGIFLILVARAPAPVWEVKRNAAGRIVNLDRKGKWPYVNHFYIHLMDPDWGHVTVRMCGYPPFGAQVIANGHEWVERQARKQGLPVNKEGNCFTGGNDCQALNRIAKTLCAPHAIGRLTRACDRWLSHCLYFALPVEEKQRTDFHYQYSAFQLEYSRNLIFRRGTTLDEVYEKLLDRTRRAFDVRTLKTIFGRNHRPHRLQGERGSERLAKMIERPSYDLTVFKVHFGKLTLKIYDKGDRVLRIEAVAHNVKELRSGTAAEKLPQLIQKMQQSVVSFLNALQAAHISFLDEGTFENLTQASQRGSKRIAGLDFNKPRIRTVAAAVVALSPKPTGFTVRDLMRKAREVSGWSPEAYSARHAAYDLTKIRAKGLVERVARSRRYATKPEGVRTLCAYVVLRERVVKPLIAGAARSRLGRPPKNIHPLDRHYQNLRQELARTFETLGIATCTS